MTATPSTMAKALPSSGRAISVMTLSPLTMMGRAVSVCALMGLITITLLEGTTTGPPVAREYAVEPVGVETMMPSAMNDARNSSLTYASMPITFVVPLLASTMSLSA